MQSIFIKSTIIIQHILPITSSPFNAINIQSVNKFLFQHILPIQLFFRGLSIQLKTFDNTCKKNCPWF